MAKRKRKKKITSKVWKNYKVEGDKLERLNKSCPKCGSHVFLGKHKGRVVCGTCQYTEFFK